MELRKKYNGFSLMEMMVVLLIISIVAAASAPIVNKRMVNTAAGHTPWVWTGINNNIAYNLNGGSSSVSIGAVNPPVNSVDDPTIGASNPRLYIESGDTSTPQIALGASIANSKVMKLAYANETLWMSSKPPSMGGKGSIIMGSGASASGTYANVVALGADATIEAGTTDGVAIGSGATISGAQATAIGIISSAKDGGTAIGYDSEAGKSALALGYSAKATGESSIALGSQAQTSGKSTMAIGQSISSSGDDSILIGHNFSHNGGSSVMLGYHLTSYGANSTVIGSWCETDGDGAIAIGEDAEADGDGAIAIGAGAEADGDGAIAIGDDADADGDGAIAIGAWANAWHDNSVAIGYNARTQRPDSIAFGGDSISIPGKLVVHGDLEVEGDIIYKDQQINYQNATLGEGWRTYDADWLILGSSWWSDRRLKNVGDVFKGGLAEIKKLEPYHYTFKKDKDKTPRVGVIAQDLQKIFPDAVIKGEDGFLRIRLEDMFYALVNAVKELDAKIENLKTNEIKELRAYASKLEKDYKDLEKENKALEKRLERLEKKLK